MSKFDLRKGCLELKQALQRPQEEFFPAGADNDSANLALRMGLAAGWLTSANRLERGMADLLWTQRWNYSEAVERVAQAFRDGGSLETFDRGMSEALEIEIESARQRRDCENMVWSLRMAVQACRNKRVFLRCIDTSVAALDLMLGDLQNLDTSAST